MKQMCDLHKWPSGKVLEAFVWNGISSTCLSQFNKVYQFLDITGPYSFRGILNSNHHLPFMILATQEMRCELVFQVAGNCVGFL